MAELRSSRIARPDPDALLTLSANEARGKLKVFLGAAPGVGKTYAMLQGARRLKAEGVDIVVGLVETHGRAETAALIEGLEVLPRRRSDEHGQILEEFDLDAALARRPGLAIVDELAHSNAAGSRHPKRWQDVEELLDAGIDVWTALNIQHLESLSDVVSRITGVKVRETVPDSVLQSAADVVLVDITPGELIERLEGGKVYLPDTARRATQNFFTPGNLTALRELALRRTADRVDDQMVDYLRQNAIEGPWQTSERLLACVGPDKLSETVVRKTSRLATGLNGSWVAVHIERSGAEDVDASRLKQLDDNMHLAEQLGGELHRLSSQDVVGEVLRFAQRENITQIIIGRSKAGRLAQLFRRSMTDQIVRRSTDIAVQIITDIEKPGTKGRSRLTIPKLTDHVSGLLAAVVSVGFAVAAGELLAEWLRLRNLSMIFLTAVLFCAVRFGIWSAILAAVFSFFAYDFFFIAPIYKITIAQPDEFFALLIFLAVAVFTGSLAGRVRDQSRSVGKRVMMAERLYDYSRILSGTAKLDDVLYAAATHMRKTLSGQIVLLIPEEGELAFKVSWPPLEGLDPAEASAARWAFEKSEAAGWKTGTLPNLRFQFRPLITPRGVVGVCGFEPQHAAEPLSTDDERILTSMLEQTAIAIDRSILSEDSVKAAALHENEKLRSTLLASLSHDLRTPLASITGAVTSLRQLGDKMSREERQDLLASIEEEAGRLTRFVANLLDMSRIESGALKIRRDWVDVADAIQTAVERIRRAFPEMEIKISIAKDMPLIRGDASLLEQILFNLLDNAHKYGGDHATSVHARADGGEVLISVTDEGSGVRPGDIDKIFEKFFRGGGPDGRKAGTGLGLSISRGLVEGMGGTITVQSPAVRRRGTRLTLRFPAAQPTPPRSDA